MLLLSFQAALISFFIAGIIWFVNKVLSAKK